MLTNYSCVYIFSPDNSLQLIFYSLQYGAYIGCFDGALEELDRVLRLCEKYDIGVLLDIHAMRGSQNGLDNSGSTGNMEWTYTASDGGYTKYIGI